MRFARRVFTVAAVYGVLVLLPLYFRDAGARPEFYYGFAGVALAWQAAFLVIAHDPARYRALMLVAVLEKAAFGLPTLALYLAGRVNQQMLAAALIDLLLGTLFVVSWFRAGREVVAARV